MELIINIKNTKIMNKQDNYKYLRAKNKVERTKRFYNHLIVYIIVNIVITGFKVWNDLDSWDSFINELISFNVWITWAVWGVFLILHFLAYTFGANWEERKIEALMNKELSKK